MSFFIQPFATFEYDYLPVALLAGGIILFLVFLVFVFRPQRNFLKVFFFVLISAVSIATSFYMILGTLTLVRSSHSKGPVHWHADFRIFNCGKEIDLIDPRGFSNRLGTPTVHEHNDKRIHIEGIPEIVSIASLKNFIEEIDGHLDMTILRVPTNTGIVEMKNGDLCGKNESALQTFVWTTDNNIATQKKVESFPDYIISPHALVPPGDCVIFEFDALKERTEYICEQYKVVEKQGDINIQF